MDGEVAFVLVPVPLVLVQASWWFVLMDGRVGAHDGGVFVVIIGCAVSRACGGVALPAASHVGASIVNREGHALQSAAFQRNLAGGHFKTHPLARCRQCAHVTSRF